VKTLHFQGYSDDTFACTGPGIDVDCDTCGIGEPVYMRVWGEGGSLIVCGLYALGPACGWLIGVAPAGGDDSPIPDWSIKMDRSERPYSPLLIVEAPHDVAVELLDYKGRRVPRTSAERDQALADVRAELDRAHGTVRAMERRLANIHHESHPGRWTST
jgi:hypothetical protein